MWYKNEIPNRITMLWEYMKEERPESQPFDYSPESLIPLWDWYETLSLALDISIYLGETVIKNYPQLQVEVFSPSARQCLYV